MSEINDFTVEFTPAPWTIDPTTLGICQGIITVESVDCDAIISGAHTVAYVPTNYEPDTQHANAKLIIASPDMHAALLKAEAFITEELEVRKQSYLSDDEAGGYISQAQDTLDVVRAALVKAGGK